MQPLAIGGPAFDELGNIREAIEEHFVLGIEQIDEKRVERVARGVHLLAVHAAAGVERDAEADGDALGAEVRDRLLLAVLEDAEVFLAQVRNEPAVRVGHRGGDVDQFHGAAEPERLPIVLGRRLLLRGDGRGCERDGSEDG